MQQYTTYLDELDAQAALLIDDYGATEAAAAESVVNSAMIKLRRLVPISDLRAKGSFFTPPALAEALWANSLDSLDEESVVLDPAVGAGDLLLPPLRHLLERGHLRDLESRMRGFDIEERFVTAARTRLQLASKLMGHEVGEFSGITPADLFTVPEEQLRTATHVAMNPPFARMIGPAHGQWAGVSVNAAAVFVEEILSKLESGTKFVSLLPDVLRSGARYAQWRTRVASQLSDLSIRPMGQFDKDTDVHVFILEGVRANRQPAVWPPTGAHTSPDGCVADKFTVSVGSVVPHRDLELGPTVGYVRTQDIAGITELSQLTNSRRFAGRTHVGPLILVRRTSRPGEKTRARGVLVTTEKAFAVENHLLVLTPKDGSRETCLALLTQLEQGSTTEFLDLEIRCRHLTVGAMRSIPWKVRY